MTVYPPSDPHPYEPHRPTRAGRSGSEADLWEITYYNLPCTHCGASERNPCIHVEERP